MAAAGFPPGYALPAALALLAIWGHRYPAGVDLPQHANLVRLWLELGHGPPEYAVLYRVNEFTPYLLAYALAFPFAKWWSALVAIKALLTLAALGTPWTLARWLRAVSGDDRLAVAGFPLVFGFAYLWGFLSHCLALPCLFGYLAAFERQGETPSVGRIVGTTCWGLALFFCHGVTFGVAVVSVGLRLLVRRRPLGAWRAATHLAPLAAVTLEWLHLRESKAIAEPNWWFIDKDRLVTLFSGLFWPRASVPWAAVTVGALVVVGLVARPRMNRSLGAWIPFGVTLACFLILPEYMASTYLVGTRFCVYVQAFAVALWVSAPGRERRLEIVASVLCAASLILLNLRLYAFNVELEGFDVLAAQVEPYADVMTLLPRTDGGSDVFGPRELSEVPAWVSAENGGLIQNDSAQYFQMPVLHRSHHFPDRYRYVFARGPSASVAGRVMRDFPDATLKARAGSWALYERAPRKTGSILVVRAAEDSGTLMLDRATNGAPLSIGGAPFARGLGVHASSFVRVRAPLDKTTLEGSCGVDDAAPLATPDASVTFRIRGARGEVLFLASGVTKGAARPFSVPLDENHEVLLEAFWGGKSEVAYADWVDLR